MGGSWSADDRDQHSDVIGLATRVHHVKRLCSGAAVRGGAMLVDGRVKCGLGKGSWQVVGVAPQVNSTSVSVSVSVSSISCCCCGNAAPVLVPVQWLAAGRHVPAVLPARLLSPYLTGCPAADQCPSPQHHPPRQALSPGLHQLVSWPTCGGRAGRGSQTRAPAAPYGTLCPAACGGRGGGGRARERESVCV